MKIGISINEVLRDFLGQFIYTYNKYITPTEIKEDEITSLNFLELFNFKNIEELNRFIYSEASLEIFGHADQLSNGLINHFNYFLMDIADDGEHQIELVGKEFNKSIPSTLFFLSKTTCKATNIRFVTNAVNEWDGVDVLITADPNALANKPTGKIGVKIKAPYNADVTSDFELDTILEFFKDVQLREKILATKIINYEEIN